jgi:hypothetical protein
MAPLRPRPRPTRRSPAYPVVAGLALGVAACGGIVEGVPPDPSASDGAGAGGTVPWLAAGGGGAGVPWQPVAGGTGGVDSSPGGGSGGTTFPTGGAGTGGYYPPLGGVTGGTTYVWPAATASDMAGAGGEGTTDG